MAALSQTMKTGGDGNRYEFVRNNLLVHTGAGT